MGRPKLTPTQQGRHQVTLNLRDAELAELKRQAGVARLPVPHYLWQRVLRRGLRISDPRRLGAEEFREVRRLAVNINQAVHALHQGRPFSPGAERALRRPCGGCTSCWKRCRRGTGTTDDCQIARGRPELPGSGCLLPGRGAPG